MNHIFSTMLSGRGGLGILPARTTVAGRMFTGEGERNLCLDARFHADTSNRIVY